jgi:hypothetical protein
MFISLIIGSIFLINSVSSQKATAYGSILSKYRGSCCKNNFNLFSSHAAKNSLYHKIWDINLAHSSVSFNLDAADENITRAKNPKNAKTAIQGWLSPKIFIKISIAIIQTVISHPLFLPPVNHQFFLQ